MPQRLALPCRAGGCPVLVPNGGYCAKHEPTKEGRQADDGKFYRSSAWRKLRLLHLHNCPLCASCGKSADVVDHVHPIALGGERFALNNLQSLCQTCHNVKRSKEGRERRY